VALGAVLIAGVAIARLPTWKPAEDQYVFYCAGRGDLEILVTERGNLESQQVTQVFCEVDDIPADNINGTPILWVIPNGSSVKKGDLLVELDAAPHRERLDLQILDTERARSEQIQANAKYENQLTQNETLKADAQLQVKLAVLELQMYEDKESGTHRLEVEEIQRAIDDVNNEILAAQANLELKKNDNHGIETLFKLGYAGKNELDRSRLEYLQAESQYAAKMNHLKTQLATLTKKETYEREMSLLKLKGHVQTAERGLEQVLRDNEAKHAQATAAKEAANESLKKEEERLARYREYVEKCKIYAPADGMVAYNVSDWRDGGDIREGVPVRPRQLLLTLPNLTQMQVKTSVHESVLDQIQQGLAASVRVDAFPDRVYAAKVRTVAVLPDQSGWLASDTKVYQTVVTIDEPVEQLKPGMTAVVEIHVAKICGVVSVPVQAIVQVESQSWCYTASNNGIERRAVKLGRTNDKFVEVQSGVNVNDRVVLNPMAIIEQERQQSPAAKSS
jgi:RND family efflux transporter MFP subunit